MLNDDIGAADSLVVARRRADALADQVGLSGRCYVELFDENGDLKDLRDKRNLIVTTGRTAIIERLDSSPATSQPTHMAVGTGATAAALGDTALGAEIDRNALTSSVAATNVLTMIANWAAGDATNTAITEAGVFQAASTGILYSRAVFTAINKGASDTLQITWTYTLT